MATFFSDDLSHKDRHQLLISGVVPRPIALIASLDANGIRNLAPYSFFNAFASRPPVLAIGPAVGVRSGKVKDTWSNIMGTEECTVNMVNYAMARAMNLTAAEYPPDIDEFGKSGFTAATSSIVRPPRVMESPYSMECRLLENIELKRELGGNGNLMLLEVVAFHVADDLFTDGKIDGRRLDFIGRMGYDYYCRVTAESVFQMRQPVTPCMGIDGLPERVRSSSVLTGSDLAMLAVVEGIPERDIAFTLPQVIGSSGAKGNEKRDLLHWLAKDFLRLGNVSEAWQVLLLDELL